MIRVWFSNFIKKNINKIKNLGTKLLIVAIVVFIATIMMFSFKGTQTTTEENLDAYRPTETVIDGSDVSEEQFKKDSNIVNKFLDFCNNKEVEKAYELLSNDCKEEMYPTLEIFKIKYYNAIFAEKREYNLQSWISTKDYTIYKVRYTTDIMTTGVYEQDNIYQDYITLVKKSEEEKISIGEFILSKECDGKNEIDGIEAQIVQRKVYLTYEEYDIKIKNNSSKRILLDTLKNNKGIILEGSSNTIYTAYTNSVFISDLIISPGITKQITIKFNKDCNSSNKTKRIDFLNIVKDYDLYMENQKEYNDVAQIKIKVEE